MYHSVMDNPPTPVALISGLNYRFAKGRYGSNYSNARIFPMYCLEDEKKIMKSTRTVLDVKDELHREEAVWKSKLYNKQKYEMKDFVEVLLQAGVNPNKRE